MDASENSLPGNINPHTFPAKLWRLVNTPANKAIYWDSLGEVIIIEQELFEKLILSPSFINSNPANAFKTTNFSSFVRQLNLYGFKKADPAVKNSHHCSGDNGVCHHFYNPNFKRNHPELVANLRRLTADNKAKLQAGLNVTCRPRSRYERIVTAGSSSLLSPKHQGTTHPYSLNQSQDMTSHLGTPVPPQYLMRGHSASLSSSVFSVALRKHYPAVTLSSSAPHVPQGLLDSANHRNPNSTGFNPCSAQYQSCYYFPFCHYYHPNLVAEPITGGGFQAGPFSPQSYYQIADEVMQTPTNNCLVKVVTPERSGSVLEPSSATCKATLCDSPASTMKANPLCATPMVMHVSGNVSPVTCRQQEESVVSVPEQMPEDAISEVTSDDAKDTDIEKVSNTHMDPTQA